MDTYFHERDENSWKIVFFNETYFFKVRYLGVPLCTKKLTLVNCEALIQQVRSQFNHWSVKTLSFSGRLLLIKTVIGGITNFWCSSFMLPSACIKRIESPCGQFLWKGNLEGGHSARVSWEVVTKPKECGGLGVKNLRLWNKACCLKLIWLLFFQSGSIWVAWYKEEILQGSLSNFWTVRPNNKNSWLANKLIKMRNEVYTWIKLCIGNGTSCQFWTDNWSPFGSLDNYLRSHTTSRFGIRSNTTLAELFRDGSWHLPPPRSESFLNVQVHLTTLTLSHENDWYEWVIDDRKYTSYSTKLVYSKLRGTEPTIPWDKVVWTAGGIPKHNFLTWLFVLNRSPTRDRLIQWGLQVDPSCLLCNAAAESRDHLFFNCSYSWTIWLEVSRRCGHQPEQNWATELLNLQSLRGNRCSKRLILLGWQAVIYWVWQERNHRLHRSQFRSTVSILLLIKRQMKEKILSFRSTSPALSSSLMQLWFSTDVSPSP